MTQFTYHVSRQEHLLELIDILRHEDKPRTAYFAEIPSEYGKLRLELLGDVGVALSQSGVSMEDAETISSLLEEAVSLPSPGKEGALLDIIKAYPYAVAAYGALYDHYNSLGMRDEAIYYMKQVIALQPTYGNLTRLGRLLGQAGKFEQALLLESYLWEHHKEATPAEEYDLIRDYLITLGRSGNPQQVIATATQAMNELGNETMLVYQLVYAHIQAGNYAAARTLLDKVLPHLDPGDDLYSHFFDLSNALDELVAEQRKHRN